MEACFEDPQKPYKEALREVAEKEVERILPLLEAITPERISKELTPKNQPLFPDTLFREEDQN